MRCILNVRVSVFLNNMNVQLFTHLTLENRNDIYNVFEDESQTASNKPYIQTNDISIPLYDEWPIVSERIRVIVWRSRFRKQFFLVFF